MRMWVVIEVVDGRGSLIEYDSIAVWTPENEYGITTGFRFSISRDKELTLWNRDYVVEELTRNRCEWDDDDREYKIVKVIPYEFIGVDVD